MKRILFTRPEFSYDRVRIMLLPPSQVRGMVKAIYGTKTG